MSNGKFDPFDWSKWSNHSHLGMPEKFDFPWVKVGIHDKNELKGEENEVKSEENENII